MAQSIGKSYDEQVNYYYEAYKRNYLDENEYIDEVSRLVEDPKPLLKLIAKHKADDELDPWAKRRKGIRFLYGEEGYKQDFDKAYKYLTLAYKELEDKTCMCSTMGKFYEFKKDFTEAFNHYNQAFTIYSKENHNPCNCSVGYLAHCYYKGIGVKQDIAKAKELIHNGIAKMGKNSSNSVIYLYAHFALMGYDGFDLSTAKELLSSTHTFDRYEISRLIMIKQINAKLNIVDKSIDSLIKKSLKYASKDAIAYYKKNIKESVSYPYLREF